MSAIIRGTTPTIRYTFSSVQVSSIVAAYLTLKQGSTKIEYDLSTATVNTQCKYLSWELTQNDTLKLNPNTNVEIQIRYRLNDDTAGASAVTVVEAYKILKDGEI